MIPFILKNDELFDKNLHIPTNVDIEDTELDEVILRPKEVLSATSFIGNTKCNLSDAIEDIWKSKKTEDVVIGARIKG